MTVWNPVLTPEQWLDYAAGRFFVAWLPTGPAWVAAVPGLHEPDVGPFVAGGRPGRAYALTSPALHVSAAPALLGRLEGD